jgi:hypothetical protein
MAITTSNSMSVKARFCTFFMMNCPRRIVDNLLT